MKGFERQLLTEWRRLGLPTSEAPVVVAVSGGADSMALAIAVEALVKKKKLNNRIVIAHFNHRLRGEEANEDENFVREFCEARGVELAVEHAGKLAKANLEQSAREARYAFLARVASNIKARLVLTAHTKNDQAETFLMNLLRGAGMSGLAAMPVMRELEGEAELSAYEPSNKTLLVRPLLTWAHRDDTEAYCASENCSPRHDSMNEDIGFTRVKIRKLLIPMLEDFNPAIVDTISNTARLIGSPGQDGTGSESIDWNRETLGVAELSPLPPETLRDGLRIWLQGRRGALRGIGSVHIESIIKLIKSEKSGRMVEMPGKATVVKQKGRIRFTK